MYDEQHFTHDAAVVSFKEDADGITVDEDGDVAIDWDSVETVTIDNPPHAEAFDTKEFYRLPATVAKPIRQPYHYGEDTLVWLKKPREELKKAAWSLDNAPVTLDHPETTMVKDVDDIHGFWNDTHYIDSLDDLDSYAHIPVGDEEAKEHIEENNDVSVGFYNEIARLDDYDGVVGGGDDEEEDLDGYQTRMLFDHTAFVGVGRCPTEAGCGIDAAPSHGRGMVEVDGSFKYGTAITDISETREQRDSSHSMEETTDQPSGIHVADGTWFAVGPGEHTKDSTDYPDDAMFPVDSCSDVEDAWTLRNNAKGLSISSDTLATRIKRVADAKDCSGMPWESEDSLTTDDIADAAERYSISGRCADCDNEDEDTNDTMTEFELDLDDLTAEAALERVGDQHEGIQEIVDEYHELQELRESVDEVTEDLDAGLEEIPGLVEELREKADAFDEIKQEEKEEDAERLAEMADRFEDADEVLAEYDSHEDIVDRIELLEEATETSETTTDSGGEDPDPEEELRSGRQVPDAWK